MTRVGCAFSIFGLAGLLATGCDDSSPSSSTALHIERPGLDETIDPETGFQEVQFPLSPWSQFWSVLSEPAPPPDPFTSSTPTPRAPKDLDPRPIFEHFGIPFPEGTAAIYHHDGERDVLTITHHPGTIQEIKGILRPFLGLPSDVTLRFEFYEVPALLALRLEQSAAQHFDHTPEWKKLQNLIEESEIELLNTVTLQSRSGQRAKFEEGETVSYFAGYEKTESESKTEELLRPVFEERLVGTVIEIDPVSGDEGIIDLNFSIEYHTAPAEFPEVSRARSASFEASMPVFHEKRLLTSLGLRSGQKRLLASWTPTGKPEYEAKDVRHLVFLHGSIPMP